MAVKKTSKMACKKCGQKQNKLYGGICTACRSIISMDKEKENIEKEYDLNQYSSPKTLGIDGFVEVSKRMNEWRRAGFRGQ